jgi:hypothetical protein
MPDRYEVVRGLIWGRKGEMASAAPGEAVTPDEFAAERWAEYVAQGLVCLIVEAPAPEPPPFQPAEPPARIPFVAPVDRPPGQPHTETRVEGGPEAHQKKQRPRKRA